ncbi:hypothetical protein DFJ73DRAFT_794618, partial [Zopfochytrium polystomum]
MTTTTTTNGDTANAAAEAAEGADGAAGNINSITTTDAAAADEPVSEEITQKLFHIFISYRVRTDAELAEKLCDKLQSLSILNEQRDIRIRCFLDKQNLTQGEDFEAEFMAGLTGSCLFLPLVSEECLRSMLNLRDGGEDNVIREWETAVAMRAKREIDIIPILVGSFETTADGLRLYKRFSAFWFANEIPPVLISNSPTNTTAKDTVSSLFRLQGIFLNPSELSDKITAIINRFSTDVWPKYRPFWANQEDLGAEPVYTCVQCFKDFTRSTNADGSCRFHLTDGPKPEWSSEYACCGSADPEMGCTRNKHRAKHHNDYQYGQRIVWMASIRNYTDRSEALAELYVGDDSLFSWSIGRDAVVEVGRTVGSRDFADKLYIYGNVRGHTWFNVFAKDEMGTADDKKPIFRLSHFSGVWAEANWLVFDGEVSGVRLSCGSATSLNPRVCRIRFAWPEHTDGEGPREVFTEYEDTPVFGELPLSPSTNHTLPKTEILVAGPTLVLPSPRKRDTNLPVWSSPGCPLRLKVSNVEVRHHSYTDRDFFHVDAVVINSSSEVSSVLDARAFAKLRGDDSDPPLIFPDIPPPDEDEDETWVTLTRSWLTVNGTEAKGEAPPAPPPVPLQPVAPIVRPGFRPIIPPPPIYRPVKVEAPGLPLVVPANGGLAMSFKAAVPTRRYGGKNVGTTWLNFSWIGMKTRSPVLLDLELEDASGRTFGGMAEFVLPKVKLNAPEPDTEFWLPCDELDRFDRSLLQITSKNVLSEFRSSTDPSSPRNSDYPVFRLRCVTFSVVICVGHLRNMANEAVRVRANTPHNKVQAQGGEHAAFVDVSKFVFPDSGTVGSLRLRAVALVDLRRKVVYALRFEIANASMHAVGYYPVPVYGDALIDAPRAAETGVPPADVDAAAVEADVRWSVPGPPKVWSPDGVQEGVEGITQSTAPVAPRVTFDKDG